MFPSRIKECGVAAAMAAGGRTAWTNPDPPHMQLNLPRFFQIWSGPSAPRQFRRNNNAPHPSRCFACSFIAKPNAERDCTVVLLEGVFLTTVFMVLLSPVALSLSLCVSPPPIVALCPRIAGRCARNATGEKPLARFVDGHLARSPLFGHCDKLNRI